MSGCRTPSRLAGCVAIIALAAALAPAMLLGEAAAQTDESLPEFNPDGKLLLKDNGNGTILPVGTSTYSLPQDAVFDSEGRLFLADRGNERVVVLDREYNYSYSIGNISLTTRDGVRGTGPGELSNPSGVALNSTHVFVAERFNNRLSVFTLDGSFMRHISGPAPTPVPGYGTITFNVARGVTVTPEGIVYLSFDASAVPYYYPNGTQKGLLPGANADGMDAGRGGILAVAVPGSSSTGSIVRFLNMSDEHREVFAIGSVGDSTAEGDFKRPRDVKFSGDGRLLAVADSQNDRVQVFRLNTTDDGRATGLADALPVLVIGGLGSPPVGVAFDSASHRLAVTGSSPPTLWMYEFALPAVKSVAAAPDPGNAGGAINASALSAGRSVLVDVSFNTDLARVNTTAGIPYLALGPERNATLVPYNYSEATRTLQFAYTVQEGDTNADFEFNPDTALRLNGSAIAAGPRNVTALTALPWTGPAGGSLLAAHNIAVDTELPKLRAVYSPNASDTYTNGSRIVVALNYSEQVWAVGPADGLPSLALNVVAEGGGGASASYLSGNGTATLSFSYDVQPGDSAPDGLRHNGTDALTAGSVVDAAGNAADLVLPDSSDFAGPAIMLDTAQPRVLAVNSTSPAGTYGIGRTIDIAVTFDESVNVMESPVLALSTTPPKNALYVPDTDGDAEILFRYEVRAGDSAPGGLRHAGAGALGGGSIVDMAGNAANRTLPAPSDFAGPSIMLDTVPPRVIAVNTTLASGTYGIGQTIDIAVTFDEDVTVTGIPTLALATSPQPRGALYVPDTDGDAEILFRYEVRAGDSAPGGLRYDGTGALGADGTIADAVGNAANRTLPAPGPLAGQGIRLDAVSPRVVSVEPGSPGGTYRAGQSVEIAVTFDENVTVTGSPTLALATTPSRSALYVPDTDGDAEILFRYEVRAGDSAPGGLRHAGAGALTGGSIADAVGNTADLTLPAPVPLAGIMINTASMGGGSGNQTGGAPTVAIGPDGVPAGQGDLADRGPGVNVTIDVSGLPGAGTAGGTVQFPQGGATVTTSFASVSFPPSTTATSVPADGLLVLRVVDAGRRQPAVKP